MFRPAPYRPRAKHGPTKIHKFTRNQLPVSTKSSGNQEAKQRRYDMGWRHATCRDPKTKKRNLWRQPSSSPETWQTSWSATALKCLLCLSDCASQTSQTCHCIVTVCLLQCYVCICMLYTEYTVCLLSLVKNNCRHSNDCAVSYWCAPVASDQRTCTLLDAGAAYGARHACKSYFLLAKLWPL